jgi:Glycosyltransferase family 87
MDVLGPGALGAVAAEWLVLGWLSGVGWPRLPSSGVTFWAPRWALRLLVGSVLTALAQLVLAMIGPGFATIPLVLASASVGAVALRWVLRLGHPQPDPGPDPLPMDRRERSGWLLLGLVLVAATARALVVPEAGWDAFSHWGLRAQAYALAGTLVDAHSEHEYYPPLVPLLEAWLYLHRGAVSIDLGKTVSALLGSAFALCLAWHLRLSLRLPWLAPWLGTAIVVAATALLESFWTGQADLALTAYLTLATLALVQWQRDQRNPWLMQAALFGAGAALSKFEGLPRVGVVVAALLVEALLTRRWAGYFGAAVLLVGSAGCASLLWTAVAATHGITPNAEHFGQFQPQAIGGVLVTLGAVLGGVRTGGGVLVACLAWIVAGRRMFSGRLRLVSLVVLGELLATLLAFLLSSASPEIEVQTSATRLFEQFLPLALFAGAVGLTTPRPAQDERSGEVAAHGELVEPQREDERVL